MKPNVLNRYYVTRTGLVYDCDDNDRKIKTRIQEKERNRVADVWAGGKTTTVRHVALMVATVYKPNPNNHRCIYSPDREIIDLDTMIWCTQQNKKRLEAGLKPLEKKVEPKPQKVNGQYPPKPKPVFEPSLACTLSWK